ncbi:hypothetical protein [Xanthobacter sp. VNH20]|uniref:hypothetical protein n=1 Tax=Xanthobacter TaxID=279 RepID=UPI0032B3C06D
MSKHGRDRTKHMSGYRSGDRFEPNRWTDIGHDRERRESPDDGYDRTSREGFAPASRNLRAGIWLIAALAMIVWSVLAWGAFLLVDPVFGWLSGQGGALAQAGKEIGGLLPGGKEIATVVGSVDAPGLIGSAAAAVKAVAKPVIVVIWVVGSFALLVAPKAIGTIIGRRNAIARSTALLLVASAISLQSMSGQAQAFEMQCQQATQIEHQESCMKTRQSCLIKISDTGPMS